MRMNLWRLENSRIREINVLSINVDTMAKKDSNNHGIFCDNPSMELLRCKSDWLENWFLDKTPEIDNNIGSIPKQPKFPTTLRNLKPHEDIVETNFSFWL